MRAADIVLRKASSLKTDAVEAARCGGVAVDDHEGRHVLRDACQARDHRMLSNTAELMHRAETGDNSVVPHRDVPRNGSVVGKDGVIAYLTLVGNVGVAKEEVVVPDSRRSVGGGATVDGDVFPEGVVVSDDELSLLALVFEVLSPSSERRERKGLTALADDGVAFDDDVTTQAGMCSNGDIVPDNAIRSDLTIGSNFGFGRDDCSRVNGHACLI